MPMTERAQTVIGACILVVIVAVYFAYQDHLESARKKERHQRAQKVSNGLSAGPGFRVYQTAEGTVIELAIPVNRLGDIVETKHCTVWRDKVTNTSAMACEQPGMDLGEPAPLNQ